MTLAVRKTRRSATGARSAAALLSPTFLTLGLVVGYPILAALRLSFTVESQRIDPATGLLRTVDHYGFANYLGMVSGDTKARFLNAFVNTTTFTVTCVAVETAIGLAMALVMNRASRGRGIVRASILVPWAIPTAIAGLLWRWIFQSGGIANRILHAQVLWTADGFQSWVAVVIADVWQTAPFIGLLVLAGLQTVPDEVYEAASLDGAGPARTLLRVTLPLIRPTLLVAVLFRMLDALRMFDLPYVMIGANKGSVETLSMLAQSELTNLRYGPAAAYSTVLFFYVVAIAFVFVKVLGTDIVGRGLPAQRL
jgi:multiple sugar transport system permease protein